MFNKPGHNYSQKLSPGISPRNSLTFHDMNILTHLPQEYESGDSPQKFLICGHDGYWTYLSNHQSDMHDSNIWVVSSLVVCNDPIVMLLSLMVLEGFVSTFWIFEKRGDLRILGASPQKKLIWVWWWFLAISQQPSMGYGWLWYTTGLRPKGKFGTVWMVCTCYTLGVETVVTWIFLKYRISL